MDQDLGPVLRQASETCYQRLLVVLPQPSGLFWLPWEPLQHLANCETALPLYWGCHSEHAEFNGSVERFEFREWLVPETGSELEKSPLHKGRKAGL